VRTYEIKRNSYATYVRTYLDGVEIDSMVNRDRSFDAEAYVARMQAFDAEYGDAWTI
jgi:hypothetical protein